MGIRPCSQFHSFLLGLPDINILKIEPVGGRCIDLESRPRRRRVCDNALEVDGIRRSPAEQAAGGGVTDDIDVLVLHRGEDAPGQDVLVLGEPRVHRGDHQVEVGKNLFSYPRLPSLLMSTSLPARSRQSCRRLTRSISACCFRRASGRTLDEWSVITMYS